MQAGANGGGGGGGGGGSSSRELETILTFEELCVCL
jgi:hypothetical protein